MEKLQDSMFPKQMKRGCLAAILIFLLCALEAKAQTTSFVFQNTLPQEITPATAAYEMEFKLFDSATGGTQIGGILTVADVAVKNRVFSVQLDYGAAAFPGANRFVETSVRVSNTEAFTVITNRQQVLSVPYSIRARSAATADTASQLGGVDASNFVVTTDARLADSRDPNPGSSNYIQNSFLPQAGAQFNVSGNGTVGGTLSGNVVNAATHYTINGRRVLSRPGIFNTFVGEDAGNNGVTGGANSFVGLGAGQNIAAGSENSFFGAGSGAFTTSGGQNVFVGFGAGAANTTGSSNTFVGRLAGANNTNGSFNTYIGEFAAGAPGITGATAIGAVAFVSQSNSVVIGPPIANVGIGVSGPRAKLHVEDGDLYLGTAARGVILKSPDGLTCRRLTIDNVGSLALTPIACP